jgi:hypothetical protein
MNDAKHNFKMPALVVAGLILLPWLPALLYKGPVGDKGGAFLFALAIGCSGFVVLLLVFLVCIFLPITIWRKRRQIRSTELG